SGSNDIVLQGWLGADDDSSSLMDRICRCRSELSRWKKRTDLNSRDRIVRLQAEI
ncbi:unnamed protein product, partial [Brassica oleracea var. botrytis]